MAKFDAGAAVERLDYDFTAYGGPTGTVPEPSEGQIDALLDRLRSAMPDLPADATQAQVAEATRDMKLAEQSELMLDALGELCQGSPSREQLAELPFRVRTVFQNWLLDELMNPTNGTAATRR